MDLGTNEFSNTLNPSSVIVRIATSLHRSRCLTVCLKDSFNNLVIQSNPMMLILKKMHVHTLKNQGTCKIIYNWGEGVIV